MTDLTLTIPDELIEQIRADLRANRIGCSNQCVWDGFREHRKTMHTAAVCDCIRRDNRDESRYAKRIAWLVSNALESEVTDDL